MKSMTINWKPTIQEAYTVPNLLDPILQQAIPSLIRDEIHKLANITLFQNNFQISSGTSQVPVDMSFTDNSLKIRLSESAPWISLLPSTAPMSPEEQNIDVIRRDVMAKIALLWRGAPSESSNESNQESRNTFIASSPTFRTRPSVFAQPRRNRSRRGKRAQQARSTTGGRGNPITISNNKIDSSNHSNITNNYYSNAAYQPLLNDISTGNTHLSKTTTREMGSQTLSIKDQNIARELPVKKKESTTIIVSTTSHKEIQTDLEETHSTGDSRDNVDSSGYESEQGSTDSKTEQQPSNKKAKEDIISDPKIEDLIEPFEKLQIDGFIPEYIERRVRANTEKLPEIANNTTDNLERILSDEQIIPLQTFLEDSIRETDAFIELANSDISEIDRDLHELLLKNRALLLTIQKLLESDPQLVINSLGVNELLRQLDLDTLRLIHNDDSLERTLSDEQIIPLQTFLEDSIRETDAFIELANSDISEIDRDLHELLLKNRALLLTIQKLLESDPQLVINSLGVNELLRQLDLDTLRLIHNDDSLEVPYVSEEVSDDTSILVGSVQTIFK